LPRMLRIIEDLAGDWRRLDERIEGLSSEIEPRPLIQMPALRSVARMRDLAQMLAHHDAAIEICENPGPQGPLH
jgi:hypothetical protein